MSSQHPPTAASTTPSAPAADATPAAVDATSSAAADPTSDARLLTSAVTRLRRALRASIRTDYPWETLPMAQIELLLVIAEHSPIRVGDLATRQRLATSTVSGLVGQMIDSGLVARSVDPADRRAAAVRLTEAGRDQLSAWAKAHEDRMARALALLEEPDRAAVGSALPALLRIAEHLGTAAEQQD